MTWEATHSKAPKSDGPERARRNGEQAVGETGGAPSDEKVKGEDEMTSIRLR